MKKCIVRFEVLALALSLTLTGSVLLAQQPGGRGGGQGAPGGRGTPGPPVPALLADLANKLVDAINKQDTTTIEKMIAAGALYLDEDGHAPPIQGWITKLTTGVPKQLVITGTHGQLWDDSGWVSFNYSFMETVNARPATIKGTASIVVKKSQSGEWLIQMVHGALEQHIAGFSQ